MALQPHLQCSLQSLSIPQATLTSQNIFVSSTQLVVSTPQTIFIISLEPLVLISQIPNKVDGAFPSGIRNHVLVCKNDKAQLLDVIEKKNVAICNQRIKFAQQLDNDWLFCNNDGLFKADYTFSHTEQISKVNYDDVQIQSINKDDSNNYYVATYDKSSSLYAHNNIYQLSQLQNAEFCTFLPNLDLIAGKCNSQIKLFYYGKEILGIPNMSNCVKILAFQRGFAAITSDMILQAFKIPISIIEELPIDQLYFSCLKTNYYDHSISTNLGQKYAENCFKCEKYKEAAEIAFKDEKAREFLLNQTKLSQNFPMYCIQLMKLNNLNKNETLALAQRLQQAGKIANLLKFQDNVQFSSELAEMIISENKLIDKELSTLLIKIYDNIGDYEKVATFLVKNETVSSGIHYCDIKKFYAIDLVSLITEKKLECNADDCKEILRLKLFKDVEQACDLAARNGLQIEIVQFLNTFDDAISNTLKLKYMMHFTKESKKPEVEARLCQFLFSKGVDGKKLILYCQQYKFDILGFFCALKFQLLDYQINESIDFQQCYKVLEQKPVFDEFSDAFVDLVANSVTTRQMAELLINVLDSSERLQGNTQFREVILHKQVFQENICDKRQEYLNILIENYILSNKYAKTPFVHFFAELRMSVKELDISQHKLTSKQQSNLLDALLDQILTEEDVEALLNWEIFDRLQLIRNVLQYNLIEKTAIMTTTYAKKAMCSELESVFLKLPGQQQDQLLLLLSASCNLNPEYQHLLQLIVLQSAVKSQVETAKMLLNVLYGEDQPFDVIFVNQHIFCHVLSLVSIQQDKIVNLLHQLRNFDQQNINPVILGLLSEDQPDDICNALILLILQLQSEDLLKELLKHVDSAKCIQIAKDESSAVFLARSALKAENCDYLLFFNNLRTILGGNNQDLLLKLALKTQNEEIAFEQLSASTCVLTAQHVELSVAMPRVQFEILKRSGQFLQALQLNYIEKLGFDQFELARQSQDVICCNYCIQMYSAEHFTECLSLFRLNEDLTAATDLIRAAKTSDQQEALAPVLADIREKSKSTTYDMQIAKFYALLYEENSAVVKPLLLAIIPQLDQTLAQRSGDDLFLLEKYKAARLFYQKAKNYAALNNCCLKVGDFSGALKAAFQLNQPNIYNDLVHYKETRVFGMANLCQNDFLKEIIVASEGNDELTRDLIIALKMCCFCSVEGNIQQKDEILNNSDFQDLIATQRDSSRIQQNAQFVFCTFSPQIYDILAMLLLRVQDQSILAILKQFHGKMDIKRVRAQADKCNNPDVVTFCDVAVGDLKSAIQTLISKKNNCAQLVKLIGYTEDMEIHQQAAEMLIGENTALYFSEYLPANWQKEGLEHSLKIAEQYKQEMCSFLYSNNFYSKQIAAVFCFTNDPDSDNLEHFINLCSPQELIGLTNRKELLVRLYARNHQYEQAINICQEQQYDLLVQQADYEKNEKFTILCLAKVKDSEKFEEYVRVLKEQIKLSQLIRIAATKGLQGEILEAIVEKVEAMESREK